MKFRKKPIVIDAVQLRWDNWSDMVAHIGDAAIGIQLEDGKLGMIVHTKEGDMLARESDWIIKGIAGEFYPCNDEIFRASYDRIEEPKPLGLPGITVSFKTPTDANGEAL